MSTLLNNNDNDNINDKDNDNDNDSNNNVLGVCCKGQSVNTSLKNSHWERKAHITKKCFMEPADLMSSGNLPEM